MNITEIRNKLYGKKQIRYIPLDKIFVGMKLSKALVTHITNYNSYLFTALPIIPGHRFEKEYPKYYESNNWQTCCGQVVYVSLDKKSVVINWDDSKYSKIYVGNDFAYIEAEFYIENM